MDPQPLRTQLASNLSIGVLAFAEDQRPGPILWSTITAGPKNNSDLYGLAEVS
jgi:hypothetical protein